MRHIYENKSGKVHRLFLMTENKTSGNQMVFISGARIELNYPGLDNYVPHLLTKVNEYGFDVSASIEAERRSRLPRPEVQVVANSEDNKSVELPSTEVKLETPAIPQEEASKFVLEVTKDDTVKVPGTIKVKAPKKSIFGKNK